MFRRDCQERSGLVTCSILKGDDSTMLLIDLGPSRISNVLTTIHVSLVRSSEATLECRYIRPLNRRAEPTRLSYEVECMTANIPCMSGFAFLWLLSIAFFQALV